jgi:hypothetical protein
VAIAAAYYGVICQLTISNTHFVYSYIKASKGMAATPFPSVCWQLPPEPVLAKSPITRIILYSGTACNLIRQEGREWNKISILWGAGARFT